MGNRCGGAASQAEEEREVTQTQTRGEEGDGCSFQSKAGQREVFRPQSLLDAATARLMRRHSNHVTFASHSRRKRAYYIGDAKSIADKIRVSPAD